MRQMGPVLVQERQVMEEHCPGGRCLFPPRGVALQGSSHRTRYHGKRWSFQSVLRKAYTDWVRSNRAVGTQTIVVRVSPDALWGSIPIRGSRSVADATAWVSSRRGLRMVSSSVGLMLARAASDRPPSLRARSTRKEEVSHRTGAC